MRTISRVYVHCSATKPSMDIGVKEIRRWHTDRKPAGNGWSRVGYHRIIRRSGLIEFGLPLDQIGIHVKHDNPTTIGICMVGGISEAGRKEDNFTDDQWISLEIIKRYLDRMFPEAEWLGHRDHPKAFKACPNFDVKNWVEAQGFITGGGF